ncbi:Dimethyladenosine transferase [Marasmius crinis-equi]|uniref:Dimethyladenosine transferase n=1 Tax=Marasmius crinis-equi TaxID=585013 RepID=A0ABR3EZB5_9AGAR
MKFEEFDGLERAIFNGRNKPPHGQGGGTDMLEGNLNTTEKIENVPEEMDNTGNRAAKMDIDNFPKVGLSTRYR